uniref:Uncharacterized protein n=1 Tax=Spirodela intermedia TaxID=51605 RepID=A0A8S0XJG5_SPIIN
MPVRLFNSIFYYLLFFLTFNQSCKIEKPFMMDVI